MLGGDANVFLALENNINLVFVAFNTRFRSNNSDSTIPKVDYKYSSD